MKNRRKIYVLAPAFVLVSAVIGWTLHQAQSASARPLAELMPQGALLYVEARDFSGLLKDWTASPEKAKWLESDDYRVFSNSRLFLRLSKASDEFAAAAGVPPNTQFLKDAAGKESALAIYNIGNLEFLYVSRTGSTNFLKSALWQSRNKFQPRTSAGKTFFSRKDEESGRVVAFAAADDYVVLGTREDLVAGALELLAGSKAGALRQDGWYSQALSAAPDAPGDLRMVMNFEKIAVTPHFRTYWVQQNITEMQGYASAVSDLYREGAVYREERVILPRKSGDEAALAQTSQAVTNLLTMVPKDSGFYRAGAVTSKGALVAVEQKILAVPSASTIPAKMAPQVQLTAGQAGSGADLETRINVEPESHAETGNAMQEFEKQIANANPVAMLVVHSTQKNQDGALVNVASAVAIAANSEWDLPGIEKALQEAVAPGLTASRLGAQWQAVKDAGGYHQLDGLSPVFIAVRGKVLFLANNSGFLASVLQTKNAPRAQAVTCAAWFSHERERQDFYELTSAADHGAVAQQPQFFSQNIASFSRSFARMNSEELVTRQEKDKIHQPVTYNWAQ